MKANNTAISKMIIMGAYCVLVCAAVTFSFKTMFFSLTDANIEQNSIISKETLSNTGGGLNSDDIIKIQTVLNNLGYKIDEIDGILGIKTQEAIIKFQREYGLPADGIIEPKTLEILGIVINDNAVGDMDK